jgi:hypothetical protein
MMLHQLALMAIRMLTAHHPSQGPSLLPTLKEETESVIGKAISKALIGLVLASVVVYSLVKIGNAIESMLLALPNGQYYQIVFYGLIFAGCALALYYTFRDKEEKVEMPVVASNTTPTVWSPEIDHLNAITEFGAGFISAYKTQQNRKAARRALMIVPEQEPNIYSINN